MKPGPEPNTLPPTTRLVPIVAVKCWKCLKIAKKIAENPESPIEKSYSIDAVKWRAVLNFLSHTCYSHTFGYAESLFDCKSSSTLSQIPVVLFELRISFNNRCLNRDYLFHNAPINSRLHPPPSPATHGYFTVVHAHGVGNFNLAWLGWEIWYRSTKSFQQNTTRVTSFNMEAFNVNSPLSCANDSEEKIYEA